MSEFDQRQYRIMLQKLEAIEAGDFDSALVLDLRILLDYVETSDPDWDYDFEGGLNDLDLERACAIVETEGGASSPHHLTRKRPRECAPRQRG